MLLHVPRATEFGQSVLFPSDASNDRGEDGRQSGQSNSLTSGTTTPKDGEGNGVRVLTAEDVAEFTVKIKALYDKMNGHLDMTTSGDTV